ncbi:hypothetical protein CCACVL1_18054 [Corchorus capsularis]|uniref:Uncharacterized protein n=1 Tax=Corchorus capsularis TaxID=210143 RepID=A0A1R3HNK4_COCAP|nr:hypothetical protein CCACVL1_18054 [Corchorus capsularis]
MDCGVGQMTPFSFPGVSSNNFGKGKRPGKGGTASGRALVWALRLPVKQSKTPFLLPGVTVSYFIFISSSRLQVFIMEYIPLMASVVRRSLNSPNLEEIEEDKLRRPLGFPLLRDWNSILLESSKKARVRPDFQLITTKFENLVEADVKWRPYSRLPENFLPAPYDQNVRLELVLTSIIKAEELNDEGNDVYPDLTEQNDRQTGNPNDKLPMMSYPTRVFQKQLS